MAINPVVPIIAFTYIIARYLPNAYYTGTITVFIMMKKLISLTIAAILLTSYVHLVLAATYFGPDFSISPASAVSGGTVTMQLTTGSGTTFVAPPAGSALCNPTNPSTCTFLLQSCPALNYYQINQATVATPNAGTFMLGSATTSGLTDPSIGRFTGSTGNYPTKAFAPAINLSSTDTGSIPFGTGAGGFFALTSNLANPPNNINPEGPYYWWGVSSGLRLDQTSIVPTSASGTYKFDLEGLVFCGSAVLFFDAVMEFTVTPKSAPSITTLLSSASVVSGQTVTDTATITGGNSPTGTITFNVYSGSTAASCTGTPVASATVTLPTSSYTFSGLAVGSYEVQATYSGDVNNAGPVSSACGTEPLTVSPPPPPPGLATRTPGYWATHVPFTEYVFDNQLGGSIQIGSCLKIDDHDDLLGGFWSGISKTSNGGDRSSLDQARMQLMQQLIAAILNNAADGSTPTGVTLAQAGNDFCTGSSSTVLSDVGLLDAFNGSGDSIAFPANTPGLSLQNTSVGGKIATGLSDLVFWNVMPGDAGYPVVTDAGWS